jgi:hypothetical protein
MTQVDIERDLDRFAEYLRANGGRPLVVAVVVDLGNEIITRACSRSVEECNKMCMRLLANNMGYRMELK